MTHGVIDRLGERIRSGAEDPSRSAELQASRREHNAPMAELQERLREVGIDSTGRIKSPERIGTKLVRQPTLRLSQMQDIAGLRHVGLPGIAAQEELARRLMATFDASIDNLLFDPRFGYRAVHVIVRRDGFLVEVQLRTNDQNEWAQLMEQLADACDPAIQYGAEPAFPLAKTVARDLAALSRSILELEFNDQFNRSMDTVNGALLDAASSIAAQDPKWLAEVQRLEASMAAAQERQEVLRAQVSEATTKIAPAIQSLIVGGCH